MSNANLGEGAGGLAFVLTLDRLQTAPSNAALAGIVANTADAMEYLVLLDMERRGGWVVHDNERPVGRLRYAVLDIEENLPPVPAGTVRLVVKSEEIETSHDSPGPDVVSVFRDVAERLRSGELLQRIAGPTGEIIGRLDGQAFLVEAKWDEGHEAKTMAEGLELTGVVLARLGLQAQAWEDSIGTLSPWKYANVPLASTDATLRVGVSNGGVVSVAGDPFAPGDRQMNVHLGPVERSIRAHVDRLIESTASRSVTSHGANEELGRAIAAVVGADVREDEDYGYLLSTDLSKFPTATIAGSSEAAAFAQLGNIARRVLKDPDHHMRSHVPSDVLESLQARLLAEITEPEQKARSAQRNDMSSTNPYDPKHRDALYGRFVVENGMSLEDAELERIYGSVALPEFCIKFMRAERADGVTAEGIYEALDIRHHMGRGQEEREFLDLLIREAHLAPEAAQTLTDRLQELTAAHLKLSTMDLNEGLNDEQEAARDAIEQRVQAIVSDVEGIEEAKFSYDGRGPTVRLVFESGASNRFTQGWIVPLKDDAAGNLPDDFWQQYVPETPQSLLVQQLVDAENDRDLVGEQVARLFELATQHTKMAVELSDIDGDLAHDEGFQAVKADLRGQIRALAKDFKGVGDVEFGMDPRYPTVILELESGRKNRMSGGWGVSPGEAELEKVDVGFWRELAPDADDEHDGGYLVLSITNTSNAVFVDLGRDQEIARILREASVRIAGLAKMSEAEFPLRDVNGNRVGEAYMSETGSAEPQHGQAALFVRVATEEEGEPLEAVQAVADIVRQASERIQSGERIFMLRDANGNTVGRFEYREEPSLAKDGLIDMNQALQDGRVYLAEDGYSGIAEEAFRYVVTSGDFQPGYGQGAGEVWLVNAKGEIAPGYEEAPQVVEEKLFRALKRDERSDLLAVAEGRIPYEDFERKASGESPELG